MIQIIPISERNENHIDTNDKFYIENSDTLNSMAKKYNYAIENIILNSNDDIVCFRHDDTEFRIPLDTVNYKVTKLFENKKIGVAGVIGTLALDNNCTWWNGVPRAGGRGNYGIGAVIQGGVNQENKPIEYFMSGDTISKYFIIGDYAATVDGCCMFFHKDVFKNGLRFDEQLLDYHFYDADICLQLLEQQYKVAIIDVLLKHTSIGTPPKNFNELKKVFFEKWNKKVHGEWPISRISNFYKD